MEYYALFTNFENMALSSQSKVHFFFNQVSFSLSNRKELKKFIDKICTKEKKYLVSLNYIFCTDEELLLINKEYLAHDFYTDIITFDLSESSKEISGEIYISADRVRDNARNLGVSFKSELHRVMFHGVLHLCGYSDKTKKQVSEMRAKEDSYLRQFKP